MLKVVFDVVGLQAVHVGAPPGGAVVEVVVDHVVDHVAAQPPHEHTHAHDVRQHVVEDHVEGAHHQRGQAGGEDEAGAVKGGLWRNQTGSHTSDRRTSAQSRECVCTLWCCPCSRK